MAAPAEPPAFLTQSKNDIRTKFVDLEWAQRNRLLAGAQAPADGLEPHQFSRLTGDAITFRNRYINVEPYASNRVKLQVAEELNDYINASPVQLGNRRYIATQGPKDCSVNHFYRMITSSDISDPAVVVMLTQTHESGKEKCFQYYPLNAQESPLIISPDEAMTDSFSGQVNLEHLQDDLPSRSEHRRLKINATAADGSLMNKEVHHLLFSGWPDFLVPEGDDKDALVELIQLSARLNKPNSASTTPIMDGTQDSVVDLAVSDQTNPRVVHCSAGVGRSGTFIALDYLLSLLYSGELDHIPVDQDPIADTVDIMRQQRMMMVQGEAQFNFIYDVMREQWQIRAQATEMGNSL